MSVPIFIFLEQNNSIALTLSAFLGSLVAYFGSVLNVFSGTKSTLQDTYYNFKDFFDQLVNGIKSIFGFFKWLYAPVSHFLSWLQSEKKPNKHRQKSSQNQQQKKTGQNNTNSNYQEQTRRAKEQFKKDREEAKRQEDSGNQDKRSFEKILGVGQPYTKSELKTAYKKVASQYHPDKYEHMSENFRNEAEQEFKKIQAAYKRLSGRLE